MNPQELLEYLKDAGLELISQGKVRDTYRLDKNRLLVVASDRISVFDFKLKPEIPKKGEVLTATTHFWLTSGVVPYENHLVPSEIEEDCNFAFDLSMKDGLFELPVERCLVVKDLSGKMYPFELIFRHYLGGSVFKKYQKTGKAGGHELPPNLPKWAKLDSPLFTPSTKEEVGHDINVDANYYYCEMEKLGLGEEAKAAVDLLTDVYERAYTYAKEKGILILDTKFEIGDLILADEILTPDSSRFCLKDDWEQAMEFGRDPYFLDKQPIRDWGAMIPTPFFDEDGDSIIGINNLTPENSEHKKFVQELEVPQEIISEATDRYLKIFKLLTGMDLDKYQEEIMGVTRF